MQVKKQSGFTLIEVIVVAGIIAVLAGILVPLIFKEIDESKTARAAADIRSISSALIVFKKDTGSWPVKDGACAAGLTLLNGDGVMPNGLAAQGWDTASSLNYSEPLSTNAAACYTNWKGTYMALVNADPWLNAYFTNADGFPATGPVWILSAGPDGVVDTNVLATTVANDDIGLRLR